MIVAQTSGRASQARADSTISCTMNTRVPVQLNWRRREVSAW